MHESILLVAICKSTRQCNCLQVVVIHMSMANALFLPLPAAVQVALQLLNLTACHRHSCSSEIAL